MSIDLYIGCMYSGKTSRLITEYRKWKKIDKNILCINYNKDTRYSEEAKIVSHDKEEMGKDSEQIAVEYLREVTNIEKYDIIMINEGQFFVDLVEYCKEWCEKYNKHIIVCGLDGDFEREPLGDINRLISLADNVVKLKALCEICNDGTDGIFSKRLSKNTDKIEIGTGYIAVCRKHYNN